MCKCFHEFAPIWHIRPTKPIVFNILCGLQVGTQHALIGTDKVYLTPGDHPKCSKAELHDWF
jgi:hypothetical protein